MLAWLPASVVGSAFAVALMCAMLAMLGGMLCTLLFIIAVDEDCDFNIDKWMSNAAVIFFVIGFLAGYVININYQYAHPESESQTAIEKTDTAYQTLLNNEAHAEFDAKYKKEIAFVKRLQKLFVQLKEEQRRRIFQTWYDTNFNAWHENAKSFAIDALTTDTANMLLSNAKHFSILKITKNDGIVTISLAGQEPQRKEPYGSFIHVYPAQHHAFEWVLQRKDTEKHDDSCF